VALFVPNEDPLIFYRAIAKFAAAHLTANGSLYFEINEKMGDKIEFLLKENGFTDILIRKDLQGKVRMVKAKAFCLSVLTSFDFLVS
jgi:release factor glutamine methyltransferase